ncbi:hypothetical protein KAK07_14510 [Ideonella sp. 4Y16]|uniref:Lipoprotein n=1 Tax=Ideonella alba TaxID=2824118 RepID=A0A941BA52_9BURK|nr:hypothetical protein [Ideonella alba]MBQ0929445.1 hypothetical protein [Ideonella alba]MBQ0944547.1 hypothetical protein [Ideonella alba]
MDKVLIAITVAGLLAACASPETPAGSASQQICTREAPLGSNIPVTRCRSAEQAAREGDAARSALDAAIRPVPPRQQ